MTTSESLRTLGKGLHQMNTANAAHLDTRISAWVLSAIILSIGTDILINPHLYDVSPIFLHFHQYFSAKELGSILSGIGAIRLLALFINGTFEPIRWTPHIRMTMAGLSCFAWMYLIVGALFAKEPTIAIPIFPFILFLDLWNVAHAASEIK